ncbi:MAG TPA: dienelactone hydrolase family protein [Bacteroidales bacterium]|nr:dienelactone hydrolase family protein [Bacteroidales bacterium]
MKVFKIILIAIPVFIIATLLFFIVGRNLKVTLPAPTGQFAVGRTTFEWTDTSRLDSLALEEGLKRELFVWVWYPATKSENVTYNEYLPEDWRAAISERQGLISGLFTRKLSKVKSHSIIEAKLPSGNNTYPVILIKAGFGSRITDYTTYAEDLASNGYVVIGSESNYSSNVIVFNGGRIVGETTKGNPSGAAPSVDRDRRLDRLVSIWSDDLKSILNQLEQINSTESTHLLYKRLNLQKVGVMGHAFGGAAAFRFCFSDKRCSAGVCIDGTPFGKVNENKLSKPFMFLLADDAKYQDSASMQVIANIDTIYNQLPESRVWVNVKGTEHNNFSDQALIQDRFTSRRSGDIGSINPKRGLAVSAACLRTFFDASLKAKDAGKIKQLQSAYPEIAVKK